MPDAPIITDPTAFASLVTGTALRTVLTVKTTRSVTAQVQFDIQLAPPCTYAQLQTQDTHPQGSNRMAQGNNLPRLWKTFRHQQTQVQFEFCPAMLCTGALALHRCNIAAAEEGAELQPAKQVPAGAIIESANS